MKRKLIALALTLTTIFACFSMTMISAETANDGEGAPALEAPVVEIGGHQRTIVADTTYGIRLVGLISNLNATEVGFDITLVKNDGTKATVNQPITEVYTSIGGQVNGVDTEITAASLGSNYIFTVVIPDVLTSEAYMGYSFSAYYKMGDEKTSTEACNFIYKNANLYGSEKLERVVPTYQETVGSTSAHGGNDFAYMWNGEVYKKQYTGFWGPKGTSYSVAKFSTPTEIDHITLVSGEWYQDSNNNIKVEASLDGEVWDELFIVTNDTAPGFVPTLQSGQNCSALGYKAYMADFSVDKTTAYRYIRVASGDKGVFLSEVAIYSRKIVPYELEKLTASASDYTKAGVINESTGQGYAKIHTDGADDQLKLMWDGVIGNGTYGGLYRIKNNEAWAYSTGDLGQETVIERIIVSTPWDPRINKNAAIEVSNDGETWNMIYKLSESSFNYGDTSAESAAGSFYLNLSANKTFFDITNDTRWNSNEYRLTIDVNEATAYRYVRIIGPSLSVGEIQVFGSTVNYSDAFATTWNNVIG